MLLSQVTIEENDKYKRKILNSQPPRSDISGSSTTLQEGEQHTAATDGTNEQPTTGVFSNIFTKVIDNVVDKYLAKGSTTLFALYLSI